MSATPRPRELSSIGGALAVLATLTALACAGPPPRTPRTNVPPPRDATEALSPLANRNAPPPSAAGPPSVAVALWCAAPSGPACAAAASALGQAPSPAEAVPLALFAAARDSDDDCADPELAPLMQRVTRAIGASLEWRDQGGALEDADGLADPDRGSGCASDALPDAARVKIHAADAPEGPRFLVRVWENEP
ncbi:MAG: hypothetical protein KF729_37450 [Sandaracinaceae bacterium]|nr:hypothetical protein [Sandaracinaceae bacterium]